MKTEITKKVPLGLIGCGNISGIYLKNLTSMFNNVELIGVHDIVQERAEEVATQYKDYKIKAMSFNEMLTHKEINIVVNLTTPPFHYQVCNAVLDAGKHVYVEKPLSVTQEEGKKLIEKAKASRLLIGGAPDTFLGGGIQTCKKLIDDNWIGTPIAATAYMTCHGHESWHPDPEFYYKTGGGPLFDMGPYYLTALISLMGSIQSVSSMTNITFPTRTITSEKKFGQTIHVEVPTHVAGLMRFSSGAIGNIITSFDVWDTHLPRIEIYGTEGSLQVPDPNTFGGPVYVKKSFHKEWSEIPLTHGFAENSRGLGVSDMANCLLTGEPHRSHGDLTYHVLEIMHALHRAAEIGKEVQIESSAQVPASL